MGDNRRKADISEYNSFGREFLTDKALRQPRGSAAGLMALCVFMAVIFVIVGVDFFVSDHEFGPGFLSLVFGALCLLPVAKRLKDKKCRQDALRIAQQLGAVSGRTVSCSECERSLGISELTKRIFSLTKDGYLINIVYDARTDTLRFPNRPQEQRLRHYSCPNCGAAGELDSFAEARCEYCGSALKSFLNN